MGHFNPPLMKNTECFQCGLFVTLLCRNEVNNHLGLRDFASEYLKSVTKRKVAKKIGSLLQHIFRNKMEVGRRLNDLTGSTFSVLTPAEYCTCFDVVIHYSRRMAIAGVIREKLLLSS